MRTRRIFSIFLIGAAFALMGAQNASRPILGKSEYSPNPNRGQPESLLAFHTPSLFYENEYTGGMCFSKEGWKYVGNLFYFKLGPELRWGVTVSVTEPNGTYHLGKAEIDSKKVTYSRDAIDVKFGENYVTGKNPNYHIHYVTDKVTVDFVYKSWVKAWVPGENGKYPFGPSNKYFLDLVYAAPWADVTGYIVVNGQKHPFEGQGYIDHGHYSVPFNRMLPIWEGFIAFNWEPIDGHMWSITVFDYVTHPEYGGGRLATLFVVKDKSIVYASPLYDITASDFRKDAKVGIEFPWRYTAKTTGGSCSLQGVSTAKMSWELLDIFGELPDYARAIALKFLKRPVYWRAFGTFDGTFTCEGETVHFKQIPCFHNVNYVR